jgi:SAM-dependent methyltransferase
MRCETAGVQADGRLVSPSAERNKGPIAEILMRVLPAQGEVLEVSSGTGQHVLHFAQAMPHLRWQPTEQDADSLKSIESWLRQSPVPNVRAPLRLDVHDTIWPVHQVAAVLCINMIHIAPPSAAEALLRGAGKVIAPGGLLFLYGPYRRQGEHTAPSNQAFDDRLKAQNPEWGVRNLEDIVRLASIVGLALEQTHDMPANNLSVVFRKC